MRDKVEDFFKKNKLHCLISSLDSRVKYYDYLLYINDITRKNGVRCTDLERSILAHLMNFVYINGDVDGNKKQFDNLIDYLLTNNVFSGKALYFAHKNNLVDKGYVKKLYGKYRLSLSDDIYKLLHLDSISVCMFLKK